MTTPKLNLREISYNQSAVDVAHNEALQTLDILVQLECIDRRDTEPTSPVSGDTYILGDTPSGTNWGSESSDTIACYYSTSWVFITPKEGFILYNNALNEYWKYNGTSWVTLIGKDLGEYTVANLPTASSYPNYWALATDAAGGRTIVRSDGTNWKIVAVEGATVS